jgi:hypothetical protein
MLLEIAVFSGISVLVFSAGMIAGNRIHRSHSIPPSESLDTLKRIRRLVEDWEDVNVSHSRRSIPDRRSRLDSESCERVKTHWGVK